MKTCALTVIIAMHWIYRRLICLGTKYASINVE